MKIDDDTIGITSTIPVEAVFAAGKRPLDLNNLFVGNEEPEQYIRIAEAEGFPANVCAWIKGIYGVIKKHKIRRVIGVYGGECSNTHALFEILESLGLEIHAFSYPYRRDKSELKRGLVRFCRELGTTLGDAEKVKKDLASVREKVRRVDELCYREGKATGWENHLWLISTSDFGGDYRKYDKEITAFIREAERRKPVQEKIRLGYAGIPPICGDIYSATEERGARIVFNEFQRQFSMPYETKNLVQQYSLYTYPYDIFFRIEDIKKEIARRQLDGLIHYVQSFCFRGIQDRILRESIDIPILTLEFDRPGQADGRTIMRLEAFLEMMRSKR